MSSQLRSLVKSGVLSDAGGSPKKKTYLLTDRFSNIHYLMRHGRAARNRLDWFVALVRLVFPDQDGLDVLARVARDAALTGAEGICDARDVLRSAFARAGSAQMRKGLAHATLRETWNHDALAGLDEWFDTRSVATDMPEIAIIDFCKQMPVELRRKLGYQPGEAKWWYQLAEFLESKLDWQLAEQSYREAIKLSKHEVAPWYALGVLLAVYLGRPTEAEAAFRMAVKLSPHESVVWNGLGNALLKLGRATDAEGTYRKAIGIRPQNLGACAGLAKALAECQGDMTEARSLARMATTVDPAPNFVRQAFIRVCANCIDDWTEVLPPVAAWVVSHPASKEVFDFVVDGFIQLARLAKPADALAVLNSLPDATPFETLRDAFVAHSDREHLHRLAPERRAVVIELLRRISEKQAEDK